MFSPRNLSSSRSSPHGILARGKVLFEPIDAGSEAHRWLAGFTRELEPAKLGVNIEEEPLGPHVHELVEFPTCPLGNAGVLGGEFEPPTSLSSGASVVLERAQHGEDAPEVPELIRTSHAP